jgi:3-dehydro-L-gulonate 2-dehydrogenase
MRVPFEDLQDTLRCVLLSLGLESSRASLCAQLFAEGSRDGIASHGLNRFPRFVQMIKAGVIDVHAHPRPISSHGAVERWDGQRGPGNLNAHACMSRAITLAREHGIACVALSNTNHWMRGGAYGWQAADAGFIAICWTNTLPNMPPWGSSEPRLGNNPFVIAVPRPPSHLVLDMSLSQFSYGALESYRRRGELLPVAGGFDESGELTHDPSAIEVSGRALPIGYWKGAGLSIMLDVLAASLSGGRATHQIAPDPLRETALSQVFIAVDVVSLDPGSGPAIAEKIIEDLHAAGGDVRYPGERTLAIRQQSIAIGVEVDASIWNEVQRMRHPVDTQ